MQILPQTATRVVVREPRGDKTLTYSRQLDGSVDCPDAHHDSGWAHKLSDWMVPENLAHSVSRDYVPYRKWHVARDFLGAFGGTASMAAVMTAVGPANAGLAALSIASVTVANVTWLKDRIGQASHIAATPIARVAERNPRAWMMAGDVIQNVGTVLDASTAILPPLVYYPLLTGVSVARSVFGAATAAAGANIVPRMALRGNLGELSVKNGNQSTVATFLGATAGIATLGALTATLGFGHAVLVVSSLGAAGSLFAQYKMLRTLEYNPVSEASLRRILSHMDTHNGEVPHPDRMMAGLFHRDRITAGDRVLPVLSDPSFAELRLKYQDRPYILTLVEGRPYLVMKHDEAHQDRPPKTESPLPPGERLAQVQGMFQAVTAERLLESTEFQRRSKSEGLDRARQWVLDESFRRTPSDIRPFMQDLREAGWSVDMVRFRGEERPVVIEDLQGSFKAA